MNTLPGANLQSGTLHTLIPYQANLIAAPLILFEVENG